MFKTENASKAVHIRGNPNKVIQILTTASYSLLCLLVLQRIFSLHQTREPQIKNTSMIMDCGHGVTWPRQSTYCIVGVPMTYPVCLANEYTHIPSSGLNVPMKVTS